MQILSLTRTRTVVSGIAVAALAVGGLTLGAAPAHAAPTSTWERLAQCEASGNWHINTGNGYYGGLQFSMSTWRAHGGTGSPHKASKATQIKIAERVLDNQGWGAWPACSSKLGLRGSAGASASATVQKSSAKQAAKPVKLSKKTYTVKRGDTLSRIAGRLGVRGGWARLAAANRMADPDVLRVGQKLRLPA